MEQSLEMEARQEIVDGLREDAGPVYGVLILWRGDQEEKAWGSIVCDNRPMYL